LLVFDPWWLIIDAFITACAAGCYTIYQSDAAACLGRFHIVILQLLLHLVLTRLVDARAPGCAAALSLAQNFLSVPQMRDLRLLVALGNQAKHAGMGDRTFHPLKLRRPQRKKIWFHDCLLINGDTDGDSVTSTAVPTTDAEDVPSHPTGAADVEYEVTLDGSSVVVPAGAWPHAPWEDACGTLAPCVWSGLRLPVYGASLATGCDWGFAVPTSSCVLGPYLPLCSPIKLSLMEALQLNEPSPTDPVVVAEVDAKATAANNFNPMQDVVENDLTAVEKDSQVDPPGMADKFDLPESSQATSINTGKDDACAANTQSLLRSMCTQLRALCDSQQQQIKSLNQALDGVLADLKFLRTEHAELMAKLAAAAAALLESPAVGASVQLDLPSPVDDGAGNRAQSSLPTKQQPAAVAASSAS